MFFRVRGGYIIFTARFARDTEGAEELDKRVFNFLLVGWEVGKLGCWEAGVGLHIISTSFF